MTRRLVITADDLGRDPASTDTILALLAEGLVTATTLIPVAPDSALALERAMALGVTPHLHLTLTSEQGIVPWRPLSAGASLADADGTLPHDPFALGARGKPSEVVTELNAQRAWFLHHGGTPVAADSHAGTLYGLHGRSWLAETLQWCHEHDLAFRLPRDPRPYLGTDIPAELVGAHERAVALADELGVALPQTIITNRQSADDLGDYSALLAAMQRIIGALPEGTSELFLHPTSRGASTPVREWETRLLRDPAFRATLAAEEIELVTGWW